MVGLELELADATIRELSKYGRVKLDYLTAGFEPYSSAQRPDIFFWPNSGPNKDCIFFIELRMPQDTGRRLPTPEVLAEHREALDANHRLFFAVATSLKIDDASFREKAALKGIKILEGIKSGKDLARRTLQWSKTPQEGVKPLGGKS